MNDWRVVFLHTKRETLLKRAVEAAFPEIAVSIHVPALSDAWHCEKEYLLDYFQRWVYDPEVWSGRVLTIYGTGHYHHLTYALTKLALERRGLEGFGWTYFHWDNHRDDWGRHDSEGRLVGEMDCGSFVDSIVYDHQGIPFFIGPDTYPRRDSQGYNILGTRIPIYHNFFTQAKQRSRNWSSNRTISSQTGLELPSVGDLQETPTESYLTFDLDLLSQSEIVTHFDQNNEMTLRRICSMLDHIRPFKRIFSADILGYPDNHFHHPLSVLTVLILARKVMGLGVQRLLEYHSYAKRLQAAKLNFDYDFWEEMKWKRRDSPITEGELLEVLKCLT